MTRSSHILRISRRVGELNEINSQAAADVPCKVEEQMLGGTYLYKVSTICRANTIAPAYNYATAGKNNIICMTTFDNNLVNAFINLISSPC